MCKIRQLDFRNQYGIFYMYIVTHPKSVQYAYVYIRRTRCDICMGFRDTATTVAVVADVVDDDNNNSINNISNNNNNEGDINDDSEGEQNNNNNNNDDL
ncbi:unnamed protein product [Onchocerca ochengi]|uniref:UDENN domain-containing protein n=1 Tax=Onchocerca ochengi TaxID=42157 RepID=A0A182EIF0_ONCOC|nr:unnamed protein product [Onchocerca ochengi]